MNNSVYVYIYIYIIFFKTAVMSILLYGSTTWTLSKRIGKTPRRELHKNATSYIEQILEATLQQNSNRRATILTFQKR